MLSARSAWISCFVNLRAVELPLGTQPIQSWPDATPVQSDYGRVTIGFVEFYLVCFSLWPDEDDENSKLKLNDMTNGQNGGTPKWKLRKYSVKLPWSPRSLHITTNANNITAAYMVLTLRCAGIVPVWESHWNKKYDRNRRIPLRDRKPIKVARWR